MALLRLRDKSDLSVGVAVPAAALELSRYGPTVTTPAGITVPASSLGLTGLVPTVTEGGGVTPLYSDGFESGDYSGGDGITWSQAFSPYTYIVTSPVRTGTYSMDLRFAATADLTDYSVEPRFNFTQIDRQAWVEYYIYLPTNYKHRSQGDGSQHHKFFAFWGGTDDDYGNAGRPKIVLELWRGADDDHSNLRCIENMDGSGTSFEIDDPYYPMIGSGGVVTLGEWTRVRVFVDTGTVGDDNAVIKVWINDTVTHSQTGILNTEHGSGPTYAPGNSKFYWNRGYLMGYTNGGYDAQTDYHIDDFAVYDSDPGW